MIVVRCFIHHENTVFFFNLLNENVLANFHDNVTSTVAELNILDGVTATATEINLLDGVTATTAELNYVDGVTSAIQTQLNAKQATLVNISDSTSSNGFGTRTVSTSDPSGGSNGDIHYKVSS